MARPSLDLTVSITDAGGRQHQWGPSAKIAGDVPKGLSFSTKRGDGFATANVSLSRRIDQDYVDLGLLREVVVTGTAGDVAYEGRVNSMPRSMGTTHEVAVSAVGWMAHAKDRKFQENYVDRDLSHWGPMSVGRRITLLPSYGPVDATVEADITSGQPSLATRVTGVWAAGALGFSEALYNSTGIPIGSIYYSYKTGVNVNTTDANWTYLVAAADTDLFPSLDSTGNLRSSGVTAATGTLAATTTSRQFALVQLFYAAAGGTANQLYDVYWPCLAVYGTHGLTKRGAASATAAQGFYSSDMITDLVRRFCPKLNTDGVQQTTFVNEQAAFLERTYPYDAFLLLNRWHLWNLSVFENKTLYYRPTDLTDYDWEVRLSDPGVTVSLQGDDTEHLANGIAVTYTDVTDMKVKTVTPDDNAALLDTNPANPANIAGYPVWTETTLSTPVTEAMAVAFGQATLAEFNSPKAPGTIKVTGHIRDRAGHWQPVWKVRCDDRVCITDHPNDRNRLIVETDYVHESHELSMAVDATFQRVDAVMDRIQGALSAAGLS